MISIVPTLQRACLSRSLGTIGILTVCIGVYLLAGTPARSIGVALNGHSCRNILGVSHEYPWRARTQTLSCHDKHCSSPSRSLLGLGPWSQEGYPSWTSWNGSVSHFKVGKIIIICDLFKAQVIGLGSLVLARPLDREYPAGSTVRDYIVDARGRTVINGVTMDPTPATENATIQRDGTTIRQLPPRPSHGVLIELQNESELHTWLLQGMTRRGKTHWKDCSDYYEQYHPTALEVWARRIISNMTNIQGPSLILDQFLALRED